MALAFKALSASLYLRSKSGALLLTEDALVLQIIGKNNTEYLFPLFFNKVYCDNTF